MAITITNLETVLNTKIVNATTATPGQDLLLISKSVEALDNAIGLKAADIGVNVQAFDAQLTDVAALTPTDGNFIVGDGTNFVAESAGTARTSLGLGTASTLNVGTALNEIVQLDGSAKLPAVDGSNLTGVDSLPAQSSQSGKFLTTDGSAASWGTVNQATPGLVLVSSVVANSASGAELWYVSSTYDTYVVYGDGIVPSTNNDYLILDAYIGSSFSNSSIYSGSSIGSYSGGSATTTGSPGYNQSFGVYLSSMVSNSSSRGGGLTLHMHNPSDTTKNTHLDWTHSYTRYTNNQSMFSVGGGSIDNSSAITKLRFKFGNGNISGSFRLYGVLK